GRESPRRMDGLWLAGGERFALQAPRLDLVPVRQWASLSPRVPEGLRQWLHRAAPEGELRQVRLQGREDDWQASAALHAIGWQANAGRPGLQGLSGHVALDQDGGVLQLTPGQAAFQWPERFRDTLEFQLEGLLGWWREGEGWTLGASRLSIRGPDYGTQLRAELAFQGDGSRPRLDLAADVDTAPVTAAGRFWVLGKMPAKTIDWLDRALLEGEVREGRISLGGDLEHWPFRNDEGRLDARARVAGARVHFSDEWPDAEAMDVDVAFDGVGMSLDGQALIAGNPVDRLSGGIPDFRDPRLKLDITSATRGESLQTLMLASPLANQYGEHLRQASVSGLARVSLLLDLPLVQRLGGRRIEGHLDLAQARLADPRWDIVFTEVSGRTRFSAGGFYTQDLQVLFDGQPAVFNLTVGHDTDDPALAARARLLGEFPVKDLLARHPPLAWIDPHVDGRAFWDIRVDVPAAANGQAAPPSRLRVESDLGGVRLDLPAPLAKPAAQGLPMRLDVPLPVTAGDVQLRLGALARLRGRIDGQGRLTGALRLGEDGPLDLPDSGLVVLGQSETLDALGWIAFAGGVGENGEGKDDQPGAGGGTVLRTVDLRVGQLDLMGSLFADTHVRLARSAERTRVTLDGPEVAGAVVIPLAPGATVQGRFERLYWPEKSIADATGEDPAASPAADAAAVASDGTGQTPAEPQDEGRDPSTLPPLDFQVRDLRMGELLLGETTLLAHPVPAGLHIESFSTRSEGYQLDASGDWLRSQGGGSRSDFDVTFTARALGDLLGAFGLAGMVEDGPTTGRLQGGWAGSPGEFSLAKFEGRLQVDVGEGALLELEPGGGGRVLGLISLAEIPRRLTLDFKDFFNKGFGFNTISGEFEFVDGVATTELLLINGPAAEIRVSGSTNLRSQQYDQRIEVLPKAGGV
ncbi:MAG TPA: YhdP family protein, partial [Arenimonas sp.]|nr:YhdP family protein [Arenimonas sp.]